MRTAEDIRAEITNNRELYTQIEHAAEVLTAAYNTCKEKLNLSTKEEKQGLLNALFDEVAEITEFNTREHYIEETQNYYRLLGENIDEEGVSHPIPANVENIRTILRYLNTEDCYLWRVPLMTISYEANQYKTEDGARITTITLSEPIDTKQGRVKRFGIGKVKGELEQYADIEQL